MSTTADRIINAVIQHTYPRPAPVSAWREAAVMIVVLAGLALAALVGFRTVAVYGLDLPRGELAALTLADLAVFALAAWLDRGCRRG